MQDYLGTTLGTAMFVKIKICVVAVISTTKQKVENERARCMPVSCRRSRRGSG